MEQVGTHLVPLGLRGVDLARLLGVLLDQSADCELRHAARIALAGRPWTDAFRQPLDGAPSPTAVFEAKTASCRKRGASVDQAKADVLEFLAMVGGRLVAVTPADLGAALAAFARYGKGRGYPAQLNMGDCFAYAVATNNGADLLFKGDDFGRT